MSSQQLSYEAEDKESEISPRVSSTRRQSLQSTKPWPPYKKCQSTAEPQSTSSLQPVKTLSQVSSQQVSLRCQGSLQDCPCPPPPLPYLHHGQETLILEGFLDVEEPSAVLSSLPVPVPGPPPRAPGLCQPVHVPASRPLHQPLQEI